MLLSHSLEFRITNEMILKFADCTGDKNPIHLDSEFAEKTFFKKKIAHGFLVGSLISNVIGNHFPGNGTIYLSQNMKFLLPVFINDIITVEVSYVKKIDKRKILLNTVCKNQQKNVVITGEAIVSPSEKFLNKLK